MIAQFDQGGLGLPDRDYYLKEDAKSVELRQKYVAHVQRMLELAGEKPEQAKAGAAAVMQIETALAKGSLDLVSRRDPEKVYHKMGKAGTGGAQPGLPLERVLRCHRRARVSIHQRLLAGIREGLQRRDRERAAGRLEDLSHLAPAAQLRAAAAHGVRRGEFQFLRQDPDRNAKQCGRAGSAAWISPIANWARRWAANSSSGPSAPRARRAR